MTMTVPKKDSLTKKVLSVDEIDNLVSKEIEAYNQDESTASHKGIQEHRNFYKKYGDSDVKIELRFIGSKVNEILSKSLKKTDTDLEVCTLETQLNLLSAIMKKIWEIHRGEFTGINELFKNGQRITKEDLTEIIAGKPVIFALLIEHERVKDDAIFLRDKQAYMIAQQWAAETDQKGEPTPRAKKMIALLSGADVEALKSYVIAHQWAAEIDQKGNLTARAQEMQEVLQGSSVDNLMEKVAYYNALEGSIKHLTQMMPEDFSSIASNKPANPASEFIDKPEEQERKQKYMQKIGEKLNIVYSKMEKFPEEIAKEASEENKKKKLLAVGDALKGLYDKIEIGLRQSASGGNNKGDQKNGVIDNGAQLTLGVVVKAKQEQLEEIVNYLKNNTELSQGTNCIQKAYDAAIGIKNNWKESSKAIMRFFHAAFHVRVLFSGGKEKVIAKTLKDIAQDALVAAMPLAPLRKME